MVRWLPILRNMPPGNLVTVEDWRTPPPHVSIGRYYKEKICPLFPGVPIKGAGEVPTQPPPTSKFLEVSLQFYLRPSHLRLKTRLHGTQLKRS